jgi:peroxiredoxin Q/BCP
LDPNGKEVFRYIGKNNRDRYSFEQLESKIKELKE